LVKTDEGAAFVYNGSASGISTTAAAIVESNQVNAYSDLGLTGTILKSLVNKQMGGRYTKIRARVKYDPVTALIGQVYGPWRYVPAQIAGLSLGATAEK